MKSLKLDKYSLMNEQDTYHNKKKTTKRKKICLHHFTIMED